MSEKHSYRAEILPLPEEISRPLWSVMIPTYNCANYLRETLASVLAQDLGPEIMQIEVVDDHSTKDDPEAVVRELAGDRVKFYRQPQNVGSIKNFNTCLQRSRGKLIHLLHGDDSVREGFYHKMEQHFEEQPEIGAAFCRYICIDDQGHWQSFSNLEQPKSGVLNNWLERIAVMNFIQPPSMVVRRDVYESLGGFDNRISCCAEDWEMWVRIAANYSVGYEIEPLALYRVHSSSLTGRCASSGQNIRDLVKIIKIIQPYLPTDKSNDLSQKARENWAIYAIKDKAPLMIGIGDLKAATTQIQEAFKCSSSLKVIKQLISVLWQTRKSLIKNTMKKTVMS